MGVTLPNLSLPLPSEDQAGKIDVINDAFTRLDALSQLVVEDRTLDAPPSSPGEGQCWIVGPTPTGAWSGHAGKVAAYYGGWRIHEPKPGWIAYDRAASALLVRRASGAWEGLEAAEAADLAAAALAAAEAAQALAEAAIPSSARGAADGVASLNADGRLPVDEAPLAADYDEASSVSGTDRIILDQSGTLRSATVAEIMDITGDFVPADLSTLPAATVISPSDVIALRQGSVLRRATVSMLPSGGGGSGGGGGGGGSMAPMVVVPASALPSTILLNPTTGAGWSIADGPEGPIVTSGAEYGQVLRGGLDPITGPFQLTMCIRRPLQRRQYLGYGPIVYCAVSGEVQHLGWIQQSSFSMPAMLRVEEWVWGPSGSIAAVPTVFELNMLADTLWMRMVWDGTDIEWWLSADGIEGSGWHLVRRGSLSFSFPPTHFGWGWLSDVQYGFSTAAHKHTIRSWEIS
jgi:hypothetical protein